MYIDGEFYEKNEAKISVFDHGLLYGDGVFEGIRAYQGCLFRLRQHLDRLFDSAKYLNLKIPHSPDALVEIVKESCRRNDLRDAYVRLIVTRGVGDLGLAPWLCKQPTVICIADKIKLYPQEDYENGLHIATASTRRMGSEMLNPRVKTLNYLNNVLAKIEANNANAPEALMLNDDGFVVEATGDNIFIVRHGALLTPPTWIGALRGITRDTVIEIAHSMEIPIREEPFTRYQIITADEAFLTGTAAEVIPVTRIDARNIGDGRPGLITRTLIERFRSLVTTDGELF